MWPVKSVYVACKVYVACRHHCTVLSIFSVHSSGFVDPGQVWKVLEFNVEIVMA